MWCKTPYRRRCFESRPQNTGASLGRTTVAPRVKRQTFRVCSTKRNKPGTPVSNPRAVRITGAGDPTSMSENAAAGDEDEEYYDDSDGMPSPCMQEDQEAAGETEEDDGEEDDEEESDDDDDGELTPNAKRLKSVVDDYERVITKKDAEISRLEAENYELKNKALTEMLKIQQSHSALVNAFTGYAGVKIDSADKSSFSVQPTKIKQVFNVNEDIGESDSIDDIEAPVRFSASGVFPHAIDTNKKTHNRELQVENRRPVTLTFALVSKLDGRKVTEKSIREDGFLPFKMSILYADDQEEVSKDDFTKMELSDMCEPRFEKIRSQTMVKGKVVFMFKFNITSCDTSPKGRQFVVKVTPDVDELEDNEDLTIKTPPFTIRSKVTASRAAS